MTIKKTEYAKCLVRAAVYGQVSFQLLKAQDPGPPAFGHEPHGLGIAGAARSETVVVAKTDNNLSSFFE